MDQRSQRINVPPSEWAATVKRLMLEDPDASKAVQAAIQLEIPSWAIGGGVVRNITWDFIFQASEKTAHNDIDLVYHDPDLSETKEASIEKAVQDVTGNAGVQVRNQARVHLWYARRFGHEISPVVDIDDAISRFPETCTSVAVTGTSVDRLRVLAPCGLTDLFAGVLRRNSRQVSVEYFRERVRAKRITDTWPGVSVAHE